MQPMQKYETGDGEDSMGAGLVAMDMSKSKSVPDPEKKEELKYSSPNKSKRLRTAQT